MSVSLIYTDLLNDQTIS